MSHWREPTIENANFEAFLFNVSPHAAMQTYPPVHADFDAEMRELDDVSFLDLRPSDMFESLPMPKGYKAAHHVAHHDAGHHDQFLKLPNNYNGAAHHHHHAESTPTKDFTSGFLFEPRDENMMLMPNFVSPRVMSFAQGFGLDSSKYIGHNDYHLGMTNPAGANASFQFDDTFSMSPLNNGKFLDFGNGHHDFLTVQLPPAMSGHFPVNNTSSVPEPNVEIIEQVQYEENMISNSSSAPAIMSSPFQESFVNDGSNIVLQSRASSDESASSSNSRPISEIASSCHHCKRRRHPNELKACHRGATGGKKAPGETSRRCCRKRYCVSCLQKYGISFADADEPGWTCMACRGACECAACRRKGSN